MPKRVHANKASARRIAALLDQVQALVEQDARWSADSVLPDACADLCGLLDSLERAQSSEHTAPSADKRVVAIPEFMHWILELCGDSAPAVEVRESEFGGLGVFACGAVEENAVVMQIPDAAVMSTATAVACPLLQPVLQTQPVLQRIPSLLLALHLLVEKLRGTGSRFAPYIAVLPDLYDVPLYYSARAMRTLCASRHFPEAARLLRSCARNYLLAVGVAKRHTLPFPASAVTWAQFRWAVATVMTRQNPLPDMRPDAPPRLALVPLFDMVNHAPARMTADFDVEHGALLLYAHRAFGAGEEVTMCYGERPSHQMLIHAGFLPNHVPHDWLTLPMRLPRPDPLLRLRVSLLQRHCGTDVLAPDAAAAGDAEQPLVLHVKVRGSTCRPGSHGSDARDANEAAAALRATLLPLARVASASKEELAQLLRTSCEGGSSELDSRARALLQNWLLEHMRSGVCDAAAATGAAETGEVALEGPDGRHVSLAQELVAREQALLESVLAELDAER